jgi:hypothetical protein
MLAAPTARRSPRATSSVRHPSAMTPQSWFSYVLAAGGLADAGLDRAGAAAGAHTRSQDPADR